MKRKVLVGFTAVAVFMAGVLVTGCGTVKSGDESSSARQAARAKVKWDDDKTGYLTVNNNTGSQLILFAGSINNAHILGGVKAQASRRVDFFDTVSDPSGSFLLRAVKEETYRNKGSSMVSDDIIFAGLVTYTKNEPRAIQVNINHALAGEAYLVIQNDSNMALQIRLDRPDGPTLTTLSPMERNKKVYMEFNTDGYMFFPVYEYYDRVSMGIRSIMPTSLADGKPMMPVVPRPGVNIPIVNFEARPANLFSPFATLVVTNETDRGAYMLNGSSRMTNQNGTTMINPGSETYELNLQKQQSLTIGGLNIDLSLGASNYIKVPEAVYEAGYNYQVRVRQGAPAVVTKMGKSQTDDLSIQLVNER
jgi:uncharacterized protein YceK